MTIKHVTGVAAAAALYTVVGLSPTTAAAGAWTRPAGQTLFVVPFSYVVADKAFDDDGKRVDRNKFRMMEFSPLFEYGLTDSLTGGLQPKFRRVKVDTDTGSATNSGLAEVDGLLRYRLWSRDQAAFSIQGLVKVPVNPRENHAAALGRDQVDAEIRLLYGNRRLLERGGSIFYNAEVGYRKRFKDPDDQVRIDAYVGWSTDGPWTLVLRSANTLGVGNDRGAREVLTTAPSFRRHEAQMIASYRFTPTVSGAFGVSTTFAGRDVGVGHSGFFSLVSNF